MPLGTAIHNIEITLGKGGQLAMGQIEVMNSTLLWETRKIPFPKN